MVEGLRALPRGLDEDLQLTAHLFLTDVLGKRRRPQRTLDLALLRRGRSRRNQPVRFNGHFYNPCIMSPCVACAPRSALTAESLRLKNGSPFSLIQQGNANRSV